MAKCQQAHTEFSLREVQHFNARGVHHVLGAIEKALKDHLTILHEVWVWVLNFVENSRALALLQQNAPALVPAKYNK